MHSNQVVQTSLGYFRDPLLTVVFEVTLLREHLRRTQWVTVGIGAAADVVLTVDYGRLPWIAITLAVAFGTGSLWHVVLLVLVGPITGTPLLL